ncbi:MAG: hypothetical protein QNJ09_18825 [Paracoccaceae bacterium]|nr:hypothetical protein [Paracoccaceae bacterium]
MADYDGKAMTRLMRGGEIVSDDIVAKGMEAAANDLETEVKYALEADAQWQEANASFDERLPGILREQSPDVAELFAKRKDAAAKLQAARESVKLPRLEVKPALPRVFTGSIGGVETPAYDYDWTWSSTNGSVSLADVTARRSSGAMGVDLYCSGRGGSGTVDVAAAVGFYFRPSTENGILRIHTAPGFVMDLDTYSALGTSRASAWIGLYVGEYEVGGNGFTSAPVNTKTTLGSLDTWWSGGSRDRSTSGYAMNAQFDVDNAHWYAIWVWCGGKAHAGGDGIFSNTGAFTDLDVTVPSMTWTLY